MDTSIGKILIASLALGAGLYFIFAKFEAVEDLQDQILRQEATDGVARLDPQEAARRQDLLQSLALEARQGLSREILNAALDSEPPSYSRDCVDRWTDLLALDLTQTDLSEVPQTEPCENSPSRIESTRKTFEASCNELPLPDETDKQSQQKNEDCLRDLVIYRATVNATLNASTPLEEIRDENILLDLLIAAQAHNEDALQIKQIAERLHQLEPNLYQPVKTLTTLELHQVAHDFANLDESQKRERLTSLAANADQAWDYGIDDPQVFEARIAAHTQMMQDPEAALGFIQEARSLKIFPHLADYYEALLEGSRGNHGRALKLLEAAATANPQSDRIRDTLEIYRANSTVETPTDPLTPLRRDWSQKPQLSLEFDLSP